MTTKPGKQPIGQYRNPVFPESFPDPFVLKFGAHYYAYCTGFAPDGGVFEILRSDNLTDWRRVGSAMQPLSSGPPFYWAPEVFYSNGKFYLYYSVGNEALMEIRVAVSDRPDGGFIDSGRRLTNEEFAIDAHVFVDEDGQKYLFYATDFLGHTHIGTGTVVDKMVDRFELEGSPKPVTRAAFDWQVYDPHRIEKGGVRWHTVEGPTVFKYKNNYFQMFSGGNWKNSTYGVGFATSPAVENSDEWLQSIDGETVFPILRTIPEKVIGPGHNSAVLGPNGRELFCVYHSWVGDARVMSIDRMGFAADRLFVNGPTFATQPAPFRPSVDFGSFSQMSAASGWRVEGGSVISPVRGAFSIGRFSDSLLLQFTSRFAAAASGGEVGIRFENGEAPLTLLFEPAQRRVSISNGPSNKQVSIPEEFDVGEFQTFAVEINGAMLDLSLNGLAMIRGFEVTPAERRIFVETEDISCEINDLLVTEGFVDLFDRGGASAQGWKCISGNSGVEVVGEELQISDPDNAIVIAAKGDVYEDFEFAANIRHDRSAGRGGTFGFVLLNDRGDVEGEFEVAGSADGYHISYNIAEGGRFALPSSYSPEKFRQFKFVRQSGVMRVESEERLLGDVKVGTFPARIGIFCKGAVVGLDMVRSIKI